MTRALLRLPLSDDQLQRMNFTTRPSNLAVAQPTKFEFIVRTSKSLMHCNKNVSVAPWVRCETAAPPTASSGHS
jgi:hypothetical protein